MTSNESLEQALEELDELYDYEWYSPYQAQVQRVIDLVKGALEQTTHGSSYGGVSWGGTYKGMRDATEKEQESTKAYINRVSTPTGIMFDEVVDDLDYVAQHPKIKTKMVVNDNCDLVNREAVINIIRSWFEKIKLNPDILIDSIVSLPSITPKSSNDIIPLSVALEAFNQKRNEDIEAFGCEIPECFPADVASEILCKLLNIDKENCSTQFDRRGL